MRQNDLRGKTALITGAAKRIGRAIALACADNGMNVVVHYNRSQTDANDLVALCKEKDVSAWPVSGDIGTDGGCKKLVDDAHAVSGKNLFLLVNNASIFPESLFADMTFDDLIGSVRINAWAPLILSRNFAARAMTGGGCVVNILDNRTEGHDSGHVAYLLSKRMLASVTRLCALELAPSVRVNGVAPGLILPPAGKTEAYLDKLKSGVPLRAHGSPSDIADAVVFCASNPFLTGEIITVDGGKHLL
jgi:pteridine reductase